MTIPHKERIINYLDDMSDEARAIGAVNTVKVENGNGWAITRTVPDLSKDYR